MRRVMQYSVKIDGFITLTFVVFSDMGRSTHFVMNPIKNVELESDIQRQIRTALYQRFLKDTSE